MMNIAITNLLKRPNRYNTALDVQEEFQFHIDMLECKYAQQGMCAAEAKAAALRRFGNFERNKKQCVVITKRGSPLRRVLKISSILIGIAGFAIQLLSSHTKVAHIGGTMIMIAVSGRLLLYVRGLSPSTFLDKTP